MPERLGLLESDSVCLVEVEGGELITPHDPTFRDAMAIYEEGARAYGDAMRALAR